MVATGPRRPTAVAVRIRADSNMAAGEVLGDRWSRSAPSTWRLPAFALLDLAPEALSDVRPRDSLPAGQFGPGADLARFQLAPPNLRSRQPFGTARNAQALGRARLFGGTAAHVSE